MRKKLFILVSFVLCITSSLSLCGCDFSDDQTTNENIVELTTENYEYYLSIDTVCTSSTSISMGTDYPYKMTISGAVSGLYVDCKLYYHTKSGTETIKEINLNAAGFATLSYSYATWNNNNSTPIFTNAEGYIHFYLA